MKTSPRPTSFAVTPRALRARAGFTLLEVLVAVGAVAVVAAGLAVVFDSVGKTVTAGRRTSRINQVGQLLKQQLATDFASMTREGFLVIRQSYADVNGDDTFTLTDDRVTVSDAERSVRARPRRVDEILFFQSGDYVSQRTPVSPGGDTERTLLAQSGEAMVYYGHGNLWNSSDVFTNVEVEGAGSIGGAYDNRLAGADGPNAFAGDWILARKQVLLTGEPSTDNRDVGDYYDIAGGSPALFDGECQVAGLPAAASIFREMNRVYGPAGSVPSTRAGADYAWYSAAPIPNASFAPAGAGGTEGVGTSPVLASGTIDLATTSLREIRRIVENFSAGPDVSDIPTAAANSILAPSLPRLVQMRRWMDNAMPTASADPVLDPLLSSLEPTSQARIRVAPQPPGMLNNFADTSAPAAAARRQAMVSRTNRQMIAAGALLTNCTEFVIEWSFGKLDASGELIWHGPPRRGSGVRPYQSNTITDPQVYLTFSTTSSGAVQVGSPLTELAVYGEDVPDAGLAAWDRVTLTSTFGYTDPTFNPNTDPTTPNWTDPNDVAGMIPWAWPTQIRVRASITDPQDQTSSNETTFEYVFFTPSNPAVN